jgi:hypothetical protein
MRLNGSEDQERRGGARVSQRNLGGLWIVSAACRVPDERSCNSGAATATTAGNVVGCDRERETLVYVLVRKIARLWRPCDGEKAELVVLPGAPTVSAISTECAWTNEVARPSIPAKWMCSGGASGTHAIAKAITTDAHERTTTGMLQRVDSTSCAARSICLSPLMGETNHQSKIGVAVWPRKPRLPACSKPGFWS